MFFWCDRRRRRTPVRGCSVLGVKTSTTGLNSPEYSASEPHFWGKEVAGLPLGRYFTGPLDIADGSNGAIRAATVFWLSSKRVILTEA